jgi:hypothetical protein
MIAHMGSIYKNSTLIIVATNTKNVKEGFVKNMPASAIFHVPYQLGNTFLISSCLKNFEV